VNQVYRGNAISLPELEMKIITMNPTELKSAASSRIVPSKVVLDIGCGIRPQTFFRPEVHICAEPYEEYLNALTNQMMKGTQPRLVLLKATWGQVVDLFPKQSVDSVFILDVIEHLEKKEGKRLLKATESIATGQIVVFTPLGFMAQHDHEGKDAWGLEGGAWQEHRSGWLPEDFGEDWEFLLSETFYTTDAWGNKLEKPHGAFYAIRQTKAMKEIPLARKPKKQEIVQKTKDLIRTVLH
jgi:hypothetical protein